MKDKYKSGIILIERLIEYIRDSIKNTGNSFYKMLLIIVLIFLIAIKEILLFFKNLWPSIVRFFKWLFRIIKQFLQLLKNLFVVILIEEIGFYYKKLKDFSGVLVENLSLISDKLGDYSDYLSDRLGGERKGFTPKIKEKYWLLVLKSILFLLITILWGTLSLFMSVFLFATTILFIPVLHQMIRKAISNKDEETITEKKTDMVEDKKEDFSESTKTDSKLKINMKNKK